LSGTDGVETIEVIGDGLKGSSGAMSALGAAAGADAEMLDLGEGTQLHPSALAKLGGCFDWRVVKICYSVTTNPLGVQVTVSVLGVQVASVTLNTAHPCLNLNLSIKGVGLKGSICIQGGCRLVGDLTLNVVFFKYSWKGTIFKWC